MEDYTEEDLDKLLEKEKPPIVVYFKAFFLLFIVGGGMLFVNFMSKNAPKPTIDDTTSRTLESILGATDKIFPQDKLEDIGKDGVEKTLESISQDVLGEATRVTNQAVEKTADSTVGYIYDNTVVKAIESMIEKLPQEQRKKLLEKLQSRYGTSTR